MGFAGIKLSGSPKIYGYWRINTMNHKEKITNPKRSFKVK